MAPLPCHTLPPVWPGFALVLAVGTAGLRQPLLAPPKTQPHILRIVALGPCRRPLGFVNTQKVEFLGIKPNAHLSHNLELDGGLLNSISSEEKNKNRKESAQWFKAEFGHLA